ncbi:MAG: hypothetical protein EOP06_02825 [Proteobacteria bacterium]|nr:MAG: hypothetical protein EOP06_02825 [Pseudomonadota bacterium]
MSKQILLSIDQLEALVPTGPYRHWSNIIGVDTDKEAELGREYYIDRNGMMSELPKGFDITLGFECIRS